MIHQLVLRTRVRISMQRPIHSHQKPAMDIFIRPLMMRALPVPLS
jgi:hypothetical protein